MLVILPATSSFYVLGQYRHGSKVCKGDTYNCNGILADAFEPHVLDGAVSTKTADTLLLLGPNDNVAEGSTLPEDEDSVSLA